MNRAQSLQMRTPLIAALLVAACGADTTPDASPELSDAAVAIESGPDAPSAPADSGSDSAEPVEPKGFVLVPAGSFVMGSPESELGRVKSEEQHDVTLTRSFWLQKLEVTQEDWKAVTGVNPATFAKCGKSCPIENVDWYAALAYANALSDAEGLPRCYTLGPAGCADDVSAWAGGDTVCEEASFAGLDCPGYRLPTAAEWEYAYRAGTTTALTNGELGVVDCGLDPLLDETGWYCGNSAVTYAGCIDTSSVGGPICAGTHPVGEKAANPWGLYDMAGNVWEYVWDWYEPHTKAPVTDPLGPDAGDKRVIRGGSWHNTASDCRAARHNAGDEGPSYFGYARGFRLARTVGD